MININDIAVLPNDTLVMNFAANFHCDVVAGLLPDISPETQALRDEILRRMQVNSDVNSGVNSGVNSA